MENLLAIFSCRVIITIIIIVFIPVWQSLLETASNSSGNFVTDPGREQPDCAEEEGGVYVQVTILSKKVGIKEDGTILLSSLSKSFVSSVYIVCIHNPLLTTYTVARGESLRNLVRLSRTKRKGYCSDSQMHFYRAIFFWQAVITFSIFTISRLHFG